MQGTAQTKQCFLHIFVAVESGDADLPITATAKPRARGTDDSGFTEQHIKKGPGIRLAFDPDIW